MEEQRWEESERRSPEVRRSEREKVRREKMQVREKVGKSRFTAFFQWFWGSGGSKSNLAKAAGAEPAGHMRDASRSDHFWKLSCRKSARRCGAKHISKSKVSKTHGLRPLLEVELSIKCTPLWCEAHFQVKMHKTHQDWTTLGSSSI